MLRASIERVTGKLRSISRHRISFIFAFAVPAYLWLLLYNTASVGAIRSDVTCKDAGTIIKWLANVSSSDTDGSSPEIPPIDLIDGAARPIPPALLPALDNTACNHQNVPDMPRGSNDMWQRRVPYFLILGAMKAGTSALNYYLTMHSRVVKTKWKEVHFYDFKFTKELYDAGTGIHRRDAREAYNAEWKRQIPVANLEELKRNASLVVFDDSPRYLFDSSTIAPRVLCVTPWVKLLALLRNPVDRAYSQYHMHLKWSVRKSPSRSSTFIGFEEWIRRDLQDLVDTGVVQSTVPLDEFAGSVQQAEAWKRYTRLGKHSPIGRGLYAIQIRQWYEVMDSVGKDRSDLKLIASDTMHEDPEGVYRDVLDFLDLERELVALSTNVHLGSYAPMANSTREMLHEFYSPYNQELSDLLGGDWEGIWEGTQ